ncbi:hypothetical protein A2U01_0059115, partial [Trifolium medium]|nr:hypothetical protein [Trifolium medium]
GKATAVTTNSSNDDGNNDGKTTTRTVITRQQQRPFQPVQWPDLCNNMPTKRRLQLTVIA